MNPKTSLESSFWALLGKYHIVGAIFSRKKVMGNFSGKKGWKEGATIISTFTIGGVGNLYITTCFEEQCYPTVPGTNPPGYGSGVLICPVPIN